MFDPCLGSARVRPICIIVDSGGSFVVSTSRGPINVRAIVFAQGAHETTAGSPHWPIDPSKVTNGARVMHSSGLGDGKQFHGARRKFVIGASKAAIDILETLDPGDESVVWAHRGHIMFHNREAIHEAMTAGVPTPPKMIAQAEVGNLFLKNQQFSPAFDGMLTSGRGICVGQPMAQQPVLRGGVESEESIAYARQFLPHQVIISSIRCHEGVLQLCLEDGRTMDVEPEDAVVLCTGQRVEGAGEGSYWKRATHNRRRPVSCGPFFQSNSHECPVHAAMRHLVSQWHSIGVQRWTGCRGSPEAGAAYGNNQGSWSVGTILGQHGWCGVFGCTAYL